MQQKKVTINGTEYTLQKIFPSAWYKLKDKNKNQHGVAQEENFYKDILKHIVVHPKKKMDDFDSIEEFEELMAEATRFQLGKDNEESESLSGDSEE